MTVRQVPPGTHRTVVAALRSAADELGEIEAYVEAAGSEPGQARRAMSFAAWDRAADGVAGALAERGVTRGDVVCLILPSCLDFAVAYAAALRLGAITSAVNPRLGPGEIESILARSRPVVTVMDSALDVPASLAGVIIDRVSLAESASGPGPARWPVLHEDDPVAVVWTSGTSGQPKGAVFDHENLAAVAAGTDFLSAPGDRRLSPLPFAHVGYMTRAWDEIAHGITTVITPNPWRASDAVRILTEEKITVAQGVPTQWALMLELDALDEADLSALRIAGTGAARISAALVMEMRSRLGVPVVVRYTSTETSLGTSTVPSDPAEVVATTVGRPVTGVEWMIADQDGQEVPRGEVGRVRLRSPAAMRGYWLDARERRPVSSPRGSAHLIDARASAEVLAADGWISTGDYGLIDEDENLHLVGRANELYIRGGYNVFPAEVEEVLQSHPLVARAAVLGAPDPVLGEVGVAFIVSTDGVGHPAMPTLAEIRALCAERLADYKAPDAVVVLDSLPLTPMMKVDKRALREPARTAVAHRLGGSSPDRPDAAVTAQL